MDALWQVLNDILDQTPPFFDGFLGGFIGAATFTFLHARWKISRRQPEE